MRLELATYQVNRIVLGTGTRYSSGVLEIDPKEVRSLALEEPFFDDVRFHVAYPGESTRIIHALDVVEPRHKASGPGPVFPGVLGPPVQVGEGRTLNLGGMAVITAAEPAAGESFFWREAIVDMSGPGAPYSPFSRTVNLVVELINRDPRPYFSTRDLEMTNTIRGSRYAQEWNIAVRRVEFKIGDYLARALRGLTPDVEMVCQLGPVDSSLPRVACAIEVLGDHLYGAPIGWQPTLLHPNELMDGALFRPYSTPASVRSITYLFQNNPVVADLYRRHGGDLNFLGVILYPSGGEQQVEKERGTSFASSLLRLLRADGVVITWIGGGHLGMDPMLLCQKCEALGIHTVVLNPEMARTTEDSGFVHFVPEADAIVNTGNYERSIALPPMDRVIGGDRLFVTGQAASGEISVTVGHILGSTSPLGPNRLMGVQY